MNFDILEFKNLLTAIHLKYGYDFTEYAEASVRRRVEYFMNSRKITSLALLSTRILNDEHEFEEFIQDVSVTVTEMFRDPTFYKSLRENVLPQLSTWPFIKIWIAGCATGEEVYSVTILLKESNLLTRSVIYATDINQKSLKIARDGVYPIDNMQKYIHNYQKSGGTHDFSNYFSAKYNSVIFHKDLRQNVVFSPHNLAVDSSFNEFQLIICRNVLIYFNQQLQNRVINLFHSSLSPFGYLALGNKESLLFSDVRPLFLDIDRKDKIFRKNA